jgi:ketosteroid isomerase-like protein
MRKLFALLAMAFAIAPSLRPQGKPDLEACYQSCRLERPNFEMQRQEVIALEREAVRAIQHNDATFFRRVYSDDFRGTLSHGQAVDKAAFIRVVQSADFQYESVSASDINVHMYRDTAIVTCLWSFRTLNKGQRLSSQMRMIHVYMYGSAGYRVIAGQATLLPPFTELPL